MLASIRAHWRQALLLALAAVIVAVAYFFLREPAKAAFAALGDVRAWILGFGPLAPVAYTLYYAAQILFAPIPGSFLPIFGGYLFGAGWGLLLSLIGLIVGVSLAIVAARRLGRPLLIRMFGAAEMAQWERKLQLRSPIPWFVLFLLPVPDMAVYAASLSSLKLRWLMGAILVGRGANIGAGILIGQASAVLPAEAVMLKWGVILLVGVLLLRYQRAIRYRLLLLLRQAGRARRQLRPA